MLEPNHQLHHDLARDVGQQVEKMILNAKRDSETKVGQEIRRIHTKIESINEKMKRVDEKLRRLDTGKSNFLKADLQKSIAKLEEVWEGEVGTLKHELWQTIQAHNHNADLMKHHKDAIDQVQQHVNETTPNMELERMHEQLQQVDKFMQREQAKQQQIDQFMQRINAVQQQLNLGPPGSYVPYRVPAPPGAMATPAPVGTSGATISAAQVKKQPKKGAKAKPKPATSGQLAAGLRAEAPEFVPTTAS